MLATSMMQSSVSITTKKWGQNDGQKRLTTSVFHQSRWKSDAVLFVTFLLDVFTKVTDCVTFLVSSFFLNLYFKKSDGHRVTVHHIFFKKLF